jgi:hypothetical protein
MDSTLGTLLLSGQYGVTLASTGYVDVGTNSGSSGVRIGRVGATTTVNGTLRADVTGDLKGSVVGDDSTFIINGIDNTVTGTTVTAGSIRLTGGTISTTDSSGITVTATTTFNSDVRVENDLTVLQRLTVQGSRVMNLSDIKSIVAASTSFADFQTKIAAMA